MRLLDEKYFWVFICVCLVYLIIINWKSCERRTEINKQIEEYQFQSKQLNYLHDETFKIDLIKSKIIQIIEKYNPKLMNKYEIVNCIYNMSLKYDNLTPELIAAVITHETWYSWNNKIESNAGAVGLMQILPRTGRWLARLENITWKGKKTLTDPIINIKLGSMYLDKMINRFGLEGGIAAYNGGPFRVNRWIRSRKRDGILREETQNYIPSVLKIYNNYRTI